MQLAATVWSAAWFAPFVLPLCFWVAWSDLARMKIPNGSVLLLLGIFLVIGPIALPLPEYGWRLAGAALVLAIGFILYLGGGIGAGDVKFAAAAAPYIHHQDLAPLLYLFAAVLVGSLAAHRILRRVPAMTRAAPDWVSWKARTFPMGLALTGTLGFYLILALIYGS